MKPPVRAGGGRRTERYRGARRKRTRLPFAGVGKPERPRNPSAYNTPGSIEPPGEGARDEATLPGRRQAVLDPPQGTGRKWRAFGPPDMFSRAARPVGPPREFCWRPGPRQRPAASRRLWGVEGFQFDLPRGKSRHPRPMPRPAIIGIQGEDATTAGRHRCYSSKIAAAPRTSPRVTTVIDSSARAPTTK